MVWLDGILVYMHVYYLIVIIWDRREVYIYINTAAKIFPYPIIISMTIQQILSGDEHLLDHIVG